jgi:hypothetical protein
VRKERRPKKSKDTPIDFWELPMDKDGVPTKEALIEWFRKQLGMEE